MLGRIEKPKKPHNNKEYYTVKSKYICSFGFKSVLYSRCFNTLNQCFMVDSINYCDGCFLSGRVCDCLHMVMSSCMLALSLFFLMYT